MNEKIGYEEPFAPSEQPSQEVLESRLQKATEAYKKLTLNPEQIKQTVAEIRETAGLRFEISPTGAAEDCLKLLAVVDHLQKTIEEKDDAIRRHVNSSNYLCNEISEWRATAEAQAAEVERLTKERDEARHRAEDILSEWHDCEGSYFANDKERFPPLW